MSHAPIPYQWDGEAMRPIPRFAKTADQQFVIGELYLMEEVQERSDASHRHEFAWLKEAWLNLPEALADQFPSPEHLRKRALIEGGFYAETIIDAGTNAAALRVAVYARAEDEFAHVVVRGPLVVVRKAKSQSRRAMRKEEFQASKTAVLEVVSAMLGVEPGTLERVTGRAA